MTEHADVQDIDEVSSRAALMGRLRSSLASFEAATGSLPEDAWQDSPGGWNALQIVEHLFQLEQVTVKSLRRATPGEALPEAERRDSFIWKAVSSRRRKVEAPPGFIPSGGLWASPVDAMAALTGARAAALELAGDETVDLRLLRNTHPLLGEMDGHQWLLLLAAHMVRHTAQMAELFGYGVTV